MNRYSQNSSKTGIRIKEFAGWVIAVFFPLAARGLVQVIHIPIISAYMASLICGVLFSLVLSNSLPYFHINIKAAKFETASICIVALTSIIIYAANYKFAFHMNFEVLMNIVAFSLLYGAFEQLIWINIVDTAGAKNKLMGFSAVVIYEILMYLLFLSMFIKITGTLGVLFLIAYTIMNIYGLIIFIKTVDITIWSIVNVILSIVIVLVNNFGINKFIFLK